MQSMAASHSIWPRERDVIFELSKKAQIAQKAIGKDNVINATIGSLMNDNGDLITLDSVFREYKNLDNKEIAAYAALEGEKIYLECVEKVCFKDYKPEGYIKVIASPGGSGAIKLGVFNYTEENDEVLTSDWFWSPYSNICEEIGRKLVTYKLFDENNKFNFNSYKEKFLEISNKQERIFTIFNTPGHNPTGYTINKDEWDNILELSKEVAKNKEKKIILFVDIAYIDFTKDDNKNREFFSKFSNLPENILVIVGFSMSKGFTAYGMRMGAAICITSSKNVAEEFYYACVHSCRANWSNCNRGAMTLLSNIVNDEEKYKEYIQEKEKYKNILRKRADIFVKEAKKVNLDILPYLDGFFISIPCKNPKEISKKLIEENLYIVPLKKGLRFAICSVNEEKCEIAPSIIKKVMESLNS